MNTVSTNLATIKNALISASDHPNTAIRKELVLGQRAVNELLANLFASMPEPPDDMGSSFALAEYADAIAEWRAKAGYPARYDGPVGIPIIVPDADYRAARMEWESAVDRESTRLGFAEWCRHQAGIDDPTLAETSLSHWMLLQIAANE